MSLLFNMLCYVFARIKCPIKLISIVAFFAFTSLPSLSRAETPSNTATDPSALEVIYSDKGFGFINVQTGTIHIEPQYSMAHTFGENGLAIVNFDFGRKVFDRKANFIDTDGRLISDTWFGDLGPFERVGLAPAKIEGKWGYIDKTGKIVVPPRSTDIYMYTHGFDQIGLSRFVDNGKWGYVRTDGSIAIGPRFETASQFSKNGLASVMENGKVGFIKADGRYAFKQKFGSAGAFSSNLAVVGQNGKEGYIREDGTYAIQPKFEVAGDFKENCTVSDTAWAKQNGLYGLIDRKGIFIIKPKFKDIEGSFCNNQVAFAQEPNSLLWGIIDRKGDFVIPPQYEDLRISTESDEIYVRIKLRGLWGYLDKNSGLVVIKPQFEEADNLAKNGRAKVKKNGVQLWIDMEGNILLKMLPFQCAGENYAWLNKDNQVILPKGIQSPCWDSVKRTARSMAQVTVSK